NAVRYAAMDAREQIAQMASVILQAPEEHLRFSDGKVFLKKDPHHAITLGEVIRTQLAPDGVVRGNGSYTYELGKDVDPQTGHSDHASAFYMYATQAAEVAVDEETGRVRLLRVVAAHDVGKAINPLNCVARVEGGLAMGIGGSLHEELVVDKQGMVRSASFLDFYLVAYIGLMEMTTI